MLPSIQASGSSSTRDGDDEIARTKRLRSRPGDGNDVGDLIGILSDEQVALCASGLSTEAVLAQTAGESPSDASLSQPTPEDTGTNGDGAAALPHGGPGQEEVASIPSPAGSRLPSVPCDPTLAIATLLLAALNDLHEPTNRGSTPLNGHLALAALGHNLGLDYGFSSPLTEDVMRSAFAKSSDTNLTFPPFDTAIKNSHDHSGDYGIHNHGDSAVYTNIETSSPLALPYPPHPPTHPAFALTRAPPPSSSSRRPRLKKPTKHLSRFFCRVCGERYTDVSSCARHIRTAHGAEQWGCTRCKTVAARKDGVCNSIAHKDAGCKEVDAKVVLVRKAVVVKARLGKGAGVRSR